MSVTQDTFQASMSWSNFVAPQNISCKFATRNTFHDPIFWLKDDALQNISQASVFNQHIRSWDVSSVADMSEMFWCAKDFNQNIGSWDVSSVTRKKIMFESAKAFT
jgi:hypothetical protein